MRTLSPSAAFGLDELAIETQRGLIVAFASSLAVILGVNLIYPVLPAVMGQFRVDPSAVGLMITAYTAPMIVLAPIADAVADLHGRRPLLFFGLMTFGIAGTGVAVAPTFEWVLILRAIQGVGASAFLPLTIVLLGDLLEGEQETNAQGAKVVLDRVALLVVPGLAGALAAASWSAPFLPYALAIPVAWLGLLWLPGQHQPTHSSLLAYVGSFRGIGRRPRLLVAFGAANVEVPA